MKVTDRELERIQRRKMDEQRVELQKVKESRLQREREREETQEQMDLEQRERDNDKFSKWQQKEDEFHLDQAMMRSKIRIQVGNSIDSGHFWGHFPGPLSGNFFSLIELGMGLQYRVRRQLSE